MTPRSDQVCEFYSDRVVRCSCYRSCPPAQNPPHGEKHDQRYEDDSHDRQEDGDNGPHDGGYELACRDYKLGRFNSPTSDITIEGYLIPGDGKISWIKGEGSGKWIYMVKNAEGQYEYECRYDEGPGDRAFMEKQDRAYLSELLKRGKLKEVEPEVWYLCEMDKAQEMDIGEWWSQKYCNKPDVADRLASAEDARERSPVID